MYYDPTVFNGKSGAAVNMLTDGRYTQQYDPNSVSGGMTGSSGFGMFDWTQFVPGGFMNSDPSMGDSAGGGGIDAQAAQEWMASNGYSLRETDIGDTGYTYLVGKDGKLMGTPTASMDYKLDKRFLAAMAAAGGITGANVLAAGFGASGLGAGAAAGGGGGSAAGAGTLEAMGGLTPVSAPVGGLGALPAAGEYGALTGGAAEGASAGLAGVDGVLTAAPGGGLFGGTAGGLLSGLPTGLTDGLGTVGNLIKDNPRIVGGLLGGLTGAIGGEEDTGPAPYTGPMPTITRGGWKPQATAQMMQAPNYGLLQPQGKQQKNSGMGRYMGLLGG